MSDLVKMLIPEGKNNRLIFFAGKGGVGKTTISSITALQLAREGFETLLLTTDPASHLGEVFGQDINSLPVRIKSEERLYAARIDQEEAVRVYKARLLREAKEDYSVDVLAMMEEQLDSPCTEEMAAFDKFVEYVSSADYEVIVFDTAPTGHTLRLLELPVDWSKQLELQAGRTVIADDLKKQAHERFDQIINDMRSEIKTVFIFVVYPEQTPIVEAWRAAEELNEIGISTRLVVANFILPEERCTTDFFKKRFKMQQAHLSNLGEKFKAPVATMPLLDNEILGRASLKKAASIFFQEQLISVNK